MGRRITVKFVLYFAIGWCVVLAVAGIALPVDPAIEFEVEVLDPLKSYVKEQLREGGVRVVDASEIVTLQGSKGERIFGIRIFGIPRLVEQTKGTVLTLRLVQTYLPAAKTEFSISDFNSLAFSLHFTYTLWESSCDAVNEYHACVTAELVHEFLQEFGNSPALPPLPEVTAADDDEWVVNRRAW